MSFWKTTDGQIVRTLTEDKDAVRFVDGRVPEGEESSAVVLEAGSGFYKMHEKASKAEVKAYLAPPADSG